MYHQRHLILHRKNTELNEMYWAMALRWFALSFINIFIPIYLYNLGFGLVTIFLYLAVLEFVCIFLVPLVGWLSAKFGPKHAMTISFPFTLAMLWLYLTLPSSPWNLWLLIFVGPVAAIFFWISYHIDFSKVKDKDKCGSEISKLQILMALVSAGAPFVGGVIATHYGIDLVFAMTIVFLALAVIPLFKTGEPHIPHSLNFNKIKLRKIYPDFISYGGLGIDSAGALIIWPLFIFLILKSYQSVGMVESLTLIVVVLVTYLAGRKIDSEDKKKVLQRSSLLNGLAWVIKSFVRSISQIIFLNLIMAVTYPFYSLSFFSQYYLHADEGSRVEYITWMEIAILIFRLFFFLLLALLAIYYDIKTVLMIALLLTAGGTFMTAFIRPVAEPAVVNNKMKG